MKTGWDERICKILDLPDTSPDLTEWENFTQLLAVRDNKINIAMVGKYMSLIDSYKSLSEALFCAGAHIGTTVNVITLIPKKSPAKTRPLCWKNTMPF